MKLAFRSGALLLMVGLMGHALASCDDGIDGASASCRVYCDKLEMCDDGTDLDGCEKICTAQLVRSEAYLQSRAQCASRLSCNVFSGEVSTMGEDRCASGERCELNDCTGDELARAKPTTDQQSYCSRAVTKLNACDRSLEPAVLSTHCLDVVPTLSDAYLQEVQVCIESDCGQVLGCLKRAADRFNTDLSLYPDPVVFD